jgi:hypothetical protein
MTLNFNSELKSFGIDIRDLIGLDQDQIKDTLIEKMPDVSSDEIDDMMEEFREAIDEMSEELKDLNLGLRDDLREASSRGKSFEESHLESEMDDISELLSQLSHIKTSGLKAFEHELDLHVSTDGPYNIQYGDSDESFRAGETLTIEATGEPATTNQKGIFGASEDKAEDKTNDGIETFADHNPLLDDEALSDAQVLFFHVNKGDQLTVKEDKGERMVIEIKSKGEEPRYVEIIGQPRVMFIGDDYMNKSELDKFQPETLERLYENDEAESFSYKLGLETMSLRDRLGYIPQFNDTISRESFDKFWSQAGGSSLSETGLSEEQAYKLFDESMERLFEELDDPDFENNRMAGAWHEILSGPIASLDLEAQQTIINTVIMSLFENTNEAIFESAMKQISPEIVGVLSQMPDRSSDLSDEAREQIKTNNKTSILLIENFSGYSAEGMNDMFWSNTFGSTGTDGSTTVGEWSSAKQNESTMIETRSNVKALESFQRFISGSDWATLPTEFTGTLQDQRDQLKYLSGADSGDVVPGETESLKFEGEQEEAWSKVISIDNTMAQKMKNHMLGEVLDQLDDVNYMDGITKNMYETLMGQLIDEFIGLISSGNTVQEITDGLISFIDAQAPAHKDNLSVGLLSMFEVANNDYAIEQAFNDPVKRTMVEVMAQLSHYELFYDKMDHYMDSKGNGASGNKPKNYISANAALKQGRSGQIPW